MIDVMEDRLSGKTCTVSNGRVMVWQGHLCEDANLTPSRTDNFCLWTRCGKHDVPGGASYEGDIKEVNCRECLEVAKDG